MLNDDCIFCSVSNSLDRACNETYRIIVLETLFIANDIELHGFLIEPQGI